MNTTAISPCPKKIFLEGLIGKLNLNGDSNAVLLTHDICNPLFSIWVLPLDLNISSPTIKWKCPIDFFFATQML